MKKLVILSILTVFISVQGFAALEYNKYIYIPAGSNEMEVDLHYTQGWAGYVGEYGKIRLAIESYYEVDGIDATVYYDRDNYGGSGQKYVRYGYEEYTLTGSGLGWDGDANDNSAYGENNVYYFYNDYGYVAAIWGCDISAWNSSGGEAGYVNIRFYSM